MKQKTLRAYAMYRLSALQAETALLKALVADIDDAEETTEAAVEAPVVAKPKAKAKPKVEEVKEEVKEETNEEVSEDLSFLEDEAGGEVALTEDDVKVAVKKFVAAFGREKVTALLAKYKAKAIQDIKAKDYEAVISLVNEALKKHKK